MRIPKPTNLHFTTYHHNFYEFMWRFPLLTEPKEQVVLQIWHTGDINCSHQVLTPVSDGFMVEQGDDFHQEYKTLDDFIESYRFSSVYKYFRNQQDVLDLIQDVSEHLHR